MYNSYHKKHYGYQKLLENYKQKKTFFTVVAGNGLAVVSGIVAGALISTPLSTERFPAKSLAPFEGCDQKSRMGQLCQEQVQLDAA